MSSAPGIAIPGSNVPASSPVSPGGAQGVQGILGPKGPAPYTVTTADFTMPAPGASVIVNVQDASWVIVGEMLTVQSAGGNPSTAASLRCTAKTGNQLTLLYQPPTTIPLASPAGAGLLAQVSGNVLDYIGGDNAPHPLGGTYLGRYSGADATNTTNYAVTVDASFSLLAGVVVWVTPSNANAANPTLNVNGTGAIPILNRAGVGLNARELAANKTFGVTYGGANWKVITPLARVVHQISSTGSLSVECAGFDSVRVLWQTSTNNGLGLTLQHVAEGVPVMVDLSNTYTAAVAYFINLTSPEGATQFSYWIWANALTGGVATRIDSSGTVNNVNAASHFLVWGENVGGNFYCK